MAFHPIHVAAVYRVHVVHDARVNISRDFRVIHNNERHASGAYGKYFTHLEEVAEEVIEIVSIDHREDLSLELNSQPSERIRAMLLDING